MQRIRTINAAFDEIKAQDPNTCITKHFLTQAIKGGGIPSTRAGVKWLVDMEDVEKYIREAVNLES